MRRLKYGIILIGALVASYGLLLFYPYPLFAHHRTVGPFDIWSDRPIPDNVEQVIADATRRLETSPLWDPKGDYRILFCNDDRRLWWLSQHFSAAMGGSTDTWLTRNVYMRRSDIAANELIAPGGVGLLDGANRPLSYFIAHEITHVLEARRYGRFLPWLYPRWLVEGYADVVGKGGIDVDAEAKRLIDRDPHLDPSSGLYRRYALTTAWWLRKGRTVDDLFRDPPDEEQTLRSIEQEAQARVAKRGPGAH